MGFLLDLARNTMGAEDGDGAVRHLRQFLHEARALSLQTFNDVSIVDDFVAHVHRRPVSHKSALDNVDRPHKLGTKAARLSQLNLRIEPLQARDQIASWHEYGGKRQRSG